MVTLGTTCPMYGGGQVANPANVIYPSTTPSSNIKVRLGTLAIVSGVAYIATASTGGVTTWTAIGGGGTGTFSNLTVSGNVSLTGTTSKLLINATTASTASVGTSAAMSSGVVTVTSSAVTTSSKILYSRDVTGGTAGQVAISAQPAGSFTLTSSSGSESSTFNYLIIN